MATTLLSAPPQVEWEHTGCPLDCPAADEPVVTGRDRLTVLPGRFSVVRCRKCRLMRTDPRPTASTITFYYPPEYQPYAATRIAPSDRPPRPWDRLSGLFAFHVDALPPLPPGRMLEVGCASGSFLQRMAEQGWQVAGIESSPLAVARAREAGHDVWQGPLETAPDAAAPYDLIVGWMVLEHLHDPVAALRKLARWLAPGGWLAVSVPNAGALWRRLFGGRWYDWSLPTHLYHFTPATLARLLDRGGFRVERTLHHRVLGPVVGSMGHLLDDWGLPVPLGQWCRAVPAAPRFSPFLLFPAAWPLALAGQTGRMTVWARKRDP
jgi:2-polyprenyl-3-methyl-5-hydroxy-6-metoxy-1,4-benzoquinol methylase